MADYLTTTAELTSVADAIRQRGGTSALLSYPEEYIAAILAIPSGGDTVDDSNFIITLTRTSWVSDADQMWEPDCTFAEAKAAYDAGKTIIFYADYGDEGEKAVLSFYVEEIQSF